MVLRNLIKFCFLMCSILLMAVNTAQAENICDPDCIIIFSFDTGGSIVANQPMSFTYAPESEINLGATGTINSAVQVESLDFSAGGVLNLAAGESITFDGNGYFELAGASNLDADDFDVITGDLAILALSGHVRLNGRLNVDGSLFIDSLTVSLSGAITANQLVVIGVDTSSVPLTDLSQIEGLTITASDGVSCTVTGNECIAENGDIYVLKNSTIVKQNSGSGSLSFQIITLLLASFLLSLARSLK